MKLLESYEQLDDLGKAGVRAIAAGALSMGLGFGLQVAGEVQINNHEPLNVPDEVPLAVMVIGGLTVFAGQRALIKDSREQQDR